MTQEGLFGEPAREALPSPKGAKSGEGPVRYLKVNLVGAKCADCSLLVYEEIREFGGSGRVIRSARTRRVQGKDSTLLCDEHANTRREQESAKPKKA